MDKYFIRVGEREVPLPAGVTVDQWSRERTYWQNPRIRAFLGCIRLLGGVMESNYAILHCSPERLTEIWRKVREVADLMLTQLAPLLDQPSRIPELEEARSHAEGALAMLADTVLEDLRRFPEQEVPPEQMLDVRKLLCVSIGKIHAYLQDTFGQIMASDPRSQHDADYFLSRRFPQDVEEAEWLYTTVEKLTAYLQGLDRERERRLVPTIRNLRSEQTLPVPLAWHEPEGFLELLIDQLTPKLKEVLALRGIRFHEMEILDRYAGEIPLQCHLCRELYEASREATDRIKAECGQQRAEKEQSVRDLVQCHTVWSARLASLLTDIDRGLRDLTAFLPIWLDGITMRRALLLKRSMDDDTEAWEEGEETDTQTIDTSEMTRH